MRKIRRNSGPSIRETSSVDSRGSGNAARLPSDYSPPSLMVRGVEKFSSSISIDVQVTIRSKLSLTRRQLCMLAGLALSEVAYSGIGLSDWMVLEFLYSSLLGNKQDPFERKDPKELELSLLLKVVLLSGTWMGLEEKKEIPLDVQSLILSSKLVPKDRVRMSWKQSWQLDKFLEIQIVPLDVFLERSRGTIRYSSYCKGYGESNRLGRRQRTRPSAELDGEEVDLEKDQTVSLNLLQIQNLLSAVLLELKYRQRS